MPDLEDLTEGSRFAASVPARPEAFPIKGRNIFQSRAPEAMIRAVGAVVHESMKPEDAYEAYLPDTASAG